MVTIFFIYMVIVLIFFLGYLISGLLFEFFPTSSITGWWRKHIITDVDLEDTPPPSDENDSLLK